MIDLHTHLLPGVDDGAKTMDESVEVLRRFSRDGVTIVVCTPHIRASQVASAPVAAHLELLGALRSELAPAQGADGAGAGPELRSGWEIMLDEPGADLTHPALALGGAHAVLVEFGRDGIPPRSSTELNRIAMSGVRPVLAHPERYWGCGAAHVREWRSAGAVIQTDASYMLGGGPKARCARTLLAEGLVDCLASDNHGDDRSLAAARDWLVESGAPVQADLLTRVNPMALLNDLPLSPVPPIVLDRGLLARLRELLVGGS